MRKVEHIRRKIVQSILLQLLTFHEDHEGLLHNVEGGDQDDDGEDERADRVGDLVLRLEVDDQRRHEDARALHEVAHHVDEGRRHVDVVPAVGVAVGVAGPAPAVAVTVRLVQRTTHTVKKYVGR